MFLLENKERDGQQRGMLVNKEILLNVINKREKIHQDKKSRIEYMRGNPFGRILVLRSQNGTRNYSNITGDRLFFVGIYNIFSDGYQEFPISYEDQRIFFRHITGNIKLPHEIGRAHV